MKYFLLCTLWIFWCFLHSFLISLKTTAQVKNRLGGKSVFYRVFYNLFSLITVLPLLYSQYTMNGPVVIQPSTVLLFIKYCALISGAVIVAGAFFTFDIGEFIGVRQIIAMSQTKQTKPVISKHGMYGIVRHPMYFGGFIFLLALMIGAPLAQFLGYGILALYMIIGTVREDRRLAHELGDIYRNYQKDVPMFLPEIFRRKNK